MANRQKRTGSTTKNTEIQGNTEQDNFEDFTESLRKLNVKIDKLLPLESLIDSLNTTVNKQGALLQSLINRIEKIESEKHQQSLTINSYKDRCEKLELQVQTLETRFDEQEQYSRRDNLVITGLRVKSYSAITSTNSNSSNITEPESVNVSATSQSNWSDRDKDIMAKNIVQFASDKLKVNISQEEIVDVHPIQSRNQRNVCIVRFNNRLARNKFIIARKELKNTKIFINEHLTLKNSLLYKEARQLRFSKKIKNCWTKNCRLFVKLNNDLVKPVNNAQELRNLIENENCNG